MNGNLWAYMIQFLHQKDIAKAVGTVKSTDRLVATRVPELEDTHKRYADNLKNK
ncbi:MAG: hypothetical protein AABY07_10905 [Nanoarchaeota archaeon]